MLLCGSPVYRQGNCNQVKGPSMKRLIFAVVSLFVATVAEAQIFPAPGQAPVRASADAPVAPGVLSTLRDGGAAGAVVVGDGSNAHCLEAKSLKIMIVTCPPFNAKGDGVTDDTAAIQAAIDYAISIGARAWMPAGKYKITDSIFVGYGDHFTTGVLEGSGTYNYAIDPGGTSIWPTFSDRPAIVIQGGRFSTLRNLSIIGQNRAWIANNHLMYRNQLLDSTVLANWIDPRLHPNANSRYAPYAGIAIDPYSGSQPATHYPGKYGKNYSSDTLIENVVVDGFVVGVVNQPGDSDGNGDFTKLRNVKLWHCVYGLSVGNSQSRNVDVDTATIAWVHTGFTNNTHGKRIGMFGGTIKNLSGGRIYQLFDFGAIGYLGSPTFLNTYIEAFYKLGSLGSGAAAEQAVQFIGGSFYFQHNDTIGHPATVLTTGSSSTAVAKFKGVQFGSYKSVLVFGEGVYFDDGSQFYLGRSSGATYEKYARNNLLGGLVIKYFKKHVGLLRQNLYNVDTGAGANYVENLSSGEGQASRTRGTPISVYSQFATPGRSEPFYNFATPYGFAKGSEITYVSNTGLDYRFTMAASTPEEQAIRGPLPGDVLWDEVSNAVFFVRYRNGTDLRANLQNNYKSDGAGGYTVLTAFNWSSGVMYCANSRIFTPDFLIVGNTTATSTVISAAGRADGYANFLTTALRTTDYMLQNDYRNKRFATGAFKVSGIDAVAKTITMTGPATKTESSVPFPFWVRLGPANVP